MKFTQTLATHLTPEWHNQYIRYQDLKTMLLKGVEDSPRRTLFNARQQYHADFNEIFFQVCEMELKKVNTFFAEKLNEAKRKQSDLLAQFEEFQRIRHRYSSRASVYIWGNVTTTKRLRKEKEMKLAFSEFYLSLVLLQNYQTLNFTGFRKILKKHDKLLNDRHGMEWFLSRVNVAPFHTNGELMNMIHDTEAVYITELEGGDRSRAMKHLRVPPMEERQQPMTTFFLGLFMGAFIVLVSVAVISYHNARIGMLNTIALIHLFRGPFLFTLFLFLISINIYGWRKAGVNHILIFEIDPRHHLTASHVMAVALAFLVLWVLCILGFLYSDILTTPPFIYPLLLMILMFCFLCNPFPVLLYKARIWTLRLVGRTLSAPFFHVGFADFWFGDQLNSMVCCVLDLEYVVCFYISNWDLYNAHEPDNCGNADFFIVPLVSCLPAWFRFAQCLRRYYDTGNIFPYLVNAGKYSTTFIVITFKTLLWQTSSSYETIYNSPYFWLYIASHTISSVYCIAWDMLKDFGVFNVFSGENIFLREQIVYPQIFYYFAIIENFLVRFAWVVYMYMQVNNIASWYTVSSIAGVLEVFRRYIWNYFRLENEHLYNCGNFRAVRDISIGPMQISAPSAITRMMDDSNGPTNRGYGESMENLRNR